MTHEPHARPPGRPPRTPEGSALSGAAFCMVAFAILVWPVGRMWSQSPRDWQMILPAFALEAFLAFLAVASIGRFYVLRSGADRPPAVAPAPVAIPYPTLDPFDPDPLLRADAPGRDVPPVAYDDDAEEPFVYPDVPTELGEPFQRIMATIRELPGDPGALAELERRYVAAAKARPRFREAEEFVIAKAERHPAYDVNAYAEPINPHNPALFLDQADTILPFAATVASMILVADGLPAEVWDLLAGPWEAAGLEFPQVELAG